MGTKTLEARVSELRCLIASEQEANVNVGRFFDLVRKWADIRAFAERIHVHQAERVNGKRFNGSSSFGTASGYFTANTYTEKGDGVVALCDYAE